MINTMISVRKLRLSSAGIAVVCCLFGLLAGCGNGTTQTATPGPQSAPATDASSTTNVRPAKWAVSIPDKTGLGNFYKVSDVLYRGEQPTAEGFVELKKMGVVTVVNLRSFHSDRSKIGETGLAYEHIYMKAWHPEDKEVVRFLQIVNDAKRQPVFVHCMHGADRTGTLCAIYRIAVQGWSKEEAIKEMTEGGYGFHKNWWGNLKTYIRELDIDEMKKRANMN